MAANMENYLPKTKIGGGIDLNRAAFSEEARKIVNIAIDHRRDNVELGGDTYRGQRFWDDRMVLARLESMFSEVEFMACPGRCIDKALIDAAQSDYWYLHEKRYDDEHYGEPPETEIADEGDDE